MPEPKGVGFTNASPGTLPRGKKHILGIAINEYAGTGWRPLNNAVADMEKIVALLQERYDFDQATLLRNSEATREAIEEALYHYTDPAVLGQNDSLLIYYSGHGHLDRNERGFWVPVNAQVNKIASYFPNSRIREIISDLKCRHLLLISDACFSGSFFTRGGPPVSEAMHEYEKRSSRWAFSSGRHDEAVSDGKAGSHSPFATAIIQELEVNEAAKLNIARLADKVTEITRANYNQMPEANPIQDAGHAGGQFVFTLRAGGTEPEPEVTLERFQTTITKQAKPVEATPKTEASGSSADAVSKLKNELRDLIGKNRTEQALEKLRTLSESQFPEIANDAITLSARWASLSRQERMGVISFSDASIERNRITSAILGLISDSL